jgi:acetoin:2,6-dichlorophenolindophenol oxidoreductase subunit alpha
MMNVRELLHVAKDIPIDNALLRRLFEQILEVRMFEEETIRLFHAAKIIGYLHPSIGNEAAEVGAAASLAKGDIVFPTHRGHGFFVARGASFRKLMAELMGRQAGYCKGRSGDLHMVAPEVGIMQVQGILGAQLPQAVGTGVAHKSMKNGKVTLCAFGDGAAGNGTFHESLNLASIWRLPVVFLCVNNGYAASFSSKKSTAVETTAIRAVGYNMAGYDVDGTDVWKVYCAVKEAADRAREGGGPSLVQVNTVRWRGHDPSDAAPYRPKEELETWDSYDPVRITREKIKDLRIMTDSEIALKTAEIKNKIDEAVEWSAAQPLSSREEYLADVRGKF